MPYPSFTWDPRAHRYRDSAGRFVPLSDIRQALDGALRGLKREMREITQSLRRGELTVGEWRLALQENIKTTHLFSAAAAKGGWGQMTQRDFGIVGSIVKKEYKYLERFALDIAGGKVALDGRALVRTEMYFESGRKTYHAIHTGEMQEAGMEEERSVLHPADHCDECIDEADRGWVPIGDLVPIGERQCLSNCHCTIQYRLAPAENAA